MKKMMLWVLCFVMAVCPALAETDTEEVYIPDTYEEIQSTWGDGDTLVVDGVCEITVDDVKFGLWEDLVEERLPSWTDRRTIAVWFSYKNTSDQPIELEDLRENIAIERYYYFVSGDEVAKWVVIGKEDSYELDFIGLEEPKQALVNDTGRLFQFRDYDITILPGETKPMAICGILHYADIEMELVPWAFSAYVGNGGGRYRIGKCYIEQGMEDQYTEVEYPGLRWGICFSKYMLNYKGYYPIEPDYTERTIWDMGYDSVFDDELVQAISEFQKDEGLEPTGRADERTFSKIMDILIEIGIEEQEKRSE